MTLPIPCPTTSDPIGVVLVDDQPAILYGLQSLIDGEKPRMTVLGTATHRADALQLTEQTQPDVILLDVDLGGESSLDFLPELLCLSPARVLVFTGLNDPAIRERAMRDGACGFASKAETAGALLQAIERAYRHGRGACAEDSGHPPVFSLQGRGVTPA